MWVSNMPSIILQFPNNLCYQAREALLAASPQNKESLTNIESAAIIVALDDSKPVTREEVARGMWVGDGRNRFYDKHQCELPYQYLHTHAMNLPTETCSHRMR
jgi:hypothetical protein